MAMNPKWHAQNVLPRGATLEQRIAWHLEHQKQCACRPIPQKLLEHLPAGEAARAKKAQAPAKPARAEKASLTKKTPTAKASPKKKARPDNTPEVDPRVHAKFEKIVQALADETGVSYGGKGFGSSALKFDGKIFAMLTSKSQFVVRLSRERAGELVSQGNGQFFDPGHGRIMKEWVVPAEGARWLQLAREACATAGKRTPSRAR